MFLNSPSRITLMGGRRAFDGNTRIENSLVNKIERELVSNFIANQDEEYILANYKKMALYLTTPELKRDFNNAIEEIINISENPQR